MKKLIESVQKLVNEELIRANKKFGPFHNYHEAYAVIKEELEEATTELEVIKSYLESFWDSVKGDCFESNIFKDVAIKRLEEMHHISLNLAAEACQVAAMIQKTLVLTQPLPKEEFKSTIDIEPMEIPKMIGFRKFGETAEECEIRIKENNLLYGIEIFTKVYGVKPNIVENLSNGNYSLSYETKQVDK